MMKKLIGLIGMIAILISMSAQVFAGDVPEALIYEDTAKVFLGTVENCTRKEIPSAPYTVIDSIEVVPTEKIKGDVEIGVKQTFTRCYSTIEFKPGVEYLFGWFDNENVYIYEIESREGNQFKLVDSDKDNMISRLEENLNNGLFEKAENERLARSEETVQQEISGSSVTDEEKVTTEQEDRPGADVRIVIGAGILVLAVIILFIVIKKKK